MIEVATESGRVRGHAADEVLSFKGIPYAAAPEGPLRFAAPAPRAAWDGVLDCAAFGSAPPQLAPAPGAPAAWRPGDGLDCLTLNVWTPDAGASSLPVMVWIYGGLWKHGSSAMPQYDGATLARSGVVVVSVDYRVGFEGFGHLPGAPDNRGLLDQLAALDWVRRNITAFGGDPDTVTVFGQSAGAASIALLAAAPAAKGLFRRAIAQSIPSGRRSVDEAAAVTATIATAAGVPATVDGFAALPPEAILAVQDAPLTAGLGLTAFGPVVDGELVTGAPAVREDVDLVCGFTDEEFRGHGPVPPRVDLDVAAAAFGLDATAAAAYRQAHPDRTDADLFVLLASDALIRIPTTKVAEAHAKAGGRTWLYDFAWQSPGLGAGHGLDVAFVFGNGGSRFAARFLGTPPHADFADLSDRVRTAWTAFAATGAPGWPRYEPPRRVTRIWDAAPKDVDDPIRVSRLIHE